MYDKASIALIPSGYKSGVVDNLYSVLPSNGNGDFNHSRSSIATRVNKDGLIESVGYAPRLDYTGNVDCPHLLLEPNRTNLVTDSSGGLYGNSPASEILTTAPDGTNTAVRPVPDSSSNRYEYTISGNTYSTDTKVTYSWYRKRISTPNNTQYTGDLLFNVLVNCTQIGSATQISTNINGYDRFSATFNITDGSQLTRVRAYFGLLIGTGNSSIAYWGHQLEEGSYPTSYIPTSGNAETRTADICNNAGTSAEFNVTEGVLFAEIKGLVDVDASNRYISLTDGTVANSVMIQYRNSGELRLYNGGTSSSNMIFRDASADLTQNKKIAIKYGSSTSNYKVFINGVEKTVDSGFSASALTALDEIKFTYVTSGNGWYGNVKQLIYFNEALSDSELQTLTS